LFLHEISCVAFMQRSVNVMVVLRETSSVSSLRRGQMNADREAFVVVNKAVTPPTREQTSASRGHGAPALCCKHHTRAASCHERCVSGWSQHTGKYAAKVHTHCAMQRKLNKMFARIKYYTLRMTSLKFTTKNARLIFL
jgi:hypothetical protein